MVYTKRKITNRFKIIVPTNLQGAMTGTYLARVARGIIELEYIDGTYESTNIDGIDLNGSWLAIIRAIQLRRKDQVTP